MSDVVRINLTGDDAQYSRMVAEQFNMPVAQVIRSSLKYARDNGLFDVGHNLTQSDTPRPKVTQAEHTQIDTPRPKVTQADTNRPNKRSLDDLPNPFTNQSA